MTYQELQITDYVKRRMREELDTVLIRGSSMNSKANSTYTEKLHIPDGETPLCSTAVKKEQIPWVEKDMAVYPPGHKSLCERCLREHHQCRKEYSDAELLAHLRYMQEVVPYANLSREVYDEYRDDHQPSGHTISKRFGGWVAAKNRLDP